MAEDLLEVRIVKPPKSVKLGPRTIDIVMLPELFDGISEQPGLCEIHERRVILCESTCADTQRETTLHELLHQALHLAGLTCAHDSVKADISEALEERLCIRVTPILLGLIRDNPRLVAYLMEK